MNFAKVVTAAALAATCASAEGLYAAFSTTIGAEFYTADTPNGDYEIFDQGGPAFHFGFDIGFPLKFEQENNHVAIGVGWDGWFQSVETNGIDDTALLMVMGPAINAKYNKLVAGVRLGTSFVIETEDGNGGTMGFGMVAYCGFEFTSNWSVIFNTHYTSTEYNNYVDIIVSGIGIGVSYNAF